MIYLGPEINNKNNNYMCKYDVLCIVKSWVNALKTSSLHDCAFLHKNRDHVTFTLDNF